MCVIAGVRPHVRVTHQALSLKASGMSGLTIIVELNRAERDLPPKSDKRAPLMATTGCPEPSNFSAWRKKNNKQTKVKDANLGDGICGNESSHGKVSNMFSLSAARRHLKLMSAIVSFYN